MHIYIGWDSREDIAYQVCKKSIEATSDIPITPLKLPELREQSVYWRDVDPLASTEFTFSRFLVPYLNGYQGWAIFADCDFLWASDVREIFDLADPTKAVQVVKHDYTPTETTKMDGKDQHLYPRKNWSSMILWNCGHPKNATITPELVNAESGAFFHQFKWLDDADIGELPLVYNWLVGWYKEPRDGVPKVLHYTSGIPAMVGYEDCEYSKIWWDIETQVE